MSVLIVWAPTRQFRQVTFVKLSDSSSAKGITAATRDQTLSVFGIQMPTGCRKESWSSASVSASPIPAEDSAA
jgi:hypothetical protein